jgi:hypothetical protein
MKKLNSKDLACSFEITTKFENSSLTRFKDHKAAIMTLKMLAEGRKPTVTS